jgi:hypothetical protein
MAQRMAGDLDGAERNLDIVVTEDPLDGEAQNARSGLRRQTPARNHVAELESLLARLKGERATIGILFALAKELEDLEHHGRSFALLRDACGRFRSSFRYDVAEDVAVLEALQQHHSVDRLRLTSRPPPDPAKNGIFIIGLPRSGTTLVERILGSHSKVFSAGELDAFPAAAIQAMIKLHGRPVNKLDFVHRSLKLDMAQLGRSYLEAANRHTGGTGRFTDKLPLNYLYAGLIHAALPGAKIISLRRHPMDVCYAMYKTLFGAAYPFTYDLIELGQYYVAWSRLMSHWQETLGRSLLTIRYENIVSQQKDSTQRLLSHCGLEWEDRCLAFDRNPNPVATASAVQVRQPLYSKSVGKWRMYVEELRPLQAYLEQHGIACD